jgi:hypothetical protein
MAEAQVISTWRKSIRVVITDSPEDPEAKQIEIQKFDKIGGRWTRIAYFRRLADYDSFLEEMTDAGDKLDDMGFVGSINIKARIGA